MKVGDTRSDDLILMMASLAEYEAGRFMLNHARHGRVVLEKQADGRWLITSVEVEP